MMDGVFVGWGRALDFLFLLLLLLLLSFDLLPLPFLGLEGLEGVENSLYGAVLDDHLLVVTAALSCISGSYALTHFVVDFDYFSLAEGEIEHISLFFKKLDIFSLLGGCPEVLFSLLFGVIDFFGLFLCFG